MNERTDSPELRAFNQVADVLAYLVIAYYEGDNDRLLAGAEDAEAILKRLAPDRLKLAVKAKAKQS